MKKIFCIISCVLAAALLYAEPVRIPFDSGAGWSFIGGTTGGFTNGVNRLNPVDGESFYFMNTYADWVNGSLYKDMGITLEEGKTYHISITVGDANHTAFVPSSPVNTPFHDSLSFGFFTGSVSAGADVRNAIQRFGANRNFKVTDFSSSIPENGWKTWSYDLSVAKNSSLNGIKVYFGIGWNSGGQTGVNRGIAIGHMSISTDSDSPSGLLVSSISKQKIALSVDMTKSSARPVTPAFFGANLLFWIDDDETLARPEFSDALNNAGVKLLRFPGGTVADNYLWKENKLVRNDRYPFEDGEAKTDWKEFLKYTKSIGAEPVFVVNTESFVRDGTAEEGAAYAAEWVRACNIEGDFPVKRWEIGNETYWHEIMTAKEYAQVVRIYAEAMRAVDPEIQLGVNGHWSINMVGNKDRIFPEALAEVTKAAKEYSESENKAEYDVLLKKSMHSNIMTGDEKWWPNVIDGCGDVVDFLIVHCYYPHTAQLGDLDENLRAVRNLYHEKWPGREIGLAMTEYNTVPQYTKDNSYLCGITGGILQMLRAEVEMACFWPVRFGGSWGHIGMLDLKTCEAQSAATVFELLSGVIGKNTIPVRDEKKALIGLAAYDDSTWAVYLADFKMNTPALIQIELPKGWENAASISYSDAASVIQQKETPVKQDGTIISFTMQPESVVIVSGKIK